MRLLRGSVQVPQRRRGKFLLRRRFSLYRAADLIARNGLTSSTAVPDEGGPNSDRVAGARRRLQEDQIRRSLHFRFQRQSADGRLVPHPGRRSGRLIEELALIRETPSSLCYVM